MANKVTTLIDVSTQDELYPRTKTSAVSDSDGNTLGDVAVWNALDVASGVNTVKVGLDMDLLWTNASTGSAFNAQTVSVDLSNYTIVLMLVMWYAADPPTRTYSMIFNADGKYNINVGKEVNTQRPINISSSGIEFQACTKYTSYNNASGTTDNNTLVPYKIYGIR